MNNQVFPLVLVQCCLVTQQENMAQELNELKKAFELFDKNKDGTICISELEDVMKSLGRDPTKEELKDMINNIDLDGNEVVDFEEFLQMMGHTQVRLLFGL